MDDDLLALDREGLAAEIRRLRQAIRAHRDSSGQELCWHHPQLWSLLPENTDSLPEVPAWPQFLRGCLAYRESLDRQLPHAPRTDVEFGKRDVSRIMDELDRAVDGDAWHGDPVASIVRGVTAAVALARPRDGVHTIWELLRHMTAWTNEVARRLEGHLPGVPPEGDWPMPSGDCDDDWQRDVAGFTDAHRRLIERISALTDAALSAARADPRDRAAGTGVPHDVMLHGLAQHHAYHAGQIALLKKLAR